jgi:hypothetical protein
MENDCRLSIVSTGTRTECIFLNTCPANGDDDRKSNIGQLGERMGVRGKGRGPAPFFLGTLGVFLWRFVQRKFQRVRIITDALIHSCRLAYGVSFTNDN